MMKKKGAAIPPHIIDEHVETIIREQFGNDRQAFIRTLAAQGFTHERFRQIEEEKIIVQAMRGQAFKTNSAIVAEPRIREYYEKNTRELHERGADAPPHARPAQERGRRKPSPQDDGGDPRKDRRPARPSKTSRACTTRARAIRPTAATGAGSAATR